MHVSNLIHFSILSHYHPYKIKEGKFIYINSMNHAFGDMAGWIPESQSSIIWLDSHIAYIRYQTDSENGLYFAGGPVQRDKRKQLN